MAFDHQAVVSGPGRDTGVLEEVGVRISMDGRERWMDNVSIVRLWRSLIYEYVYPMRSRPARRCVPA